MWVSDELQAVCFRVLPGLCVVRSSACSCIRDLGCCCCVQVVAVRLWWLNFRAATSVLMFVLEFDTVMVLFQEAPSGYVYGVRVPRMPRMDLGLNGAVFVPLWGLISSTSIWGAVLLVVTEVNQWDYDLDNWWTPCEKERLKSRREEKLKIDGTCWKKIILSPNQMEKNAQTRVARELIVFFLVSRAIYQKFWRSF